MAVQCGNIFVFIQPLLPQNFFSTRGGYCQGAVAIIAVPFDTAVACLAVEYNVTQLSRGATEERRKVTSETRELSEHNVFYRAFLVDDNVVPWLLCLLSSTSAAMQDIDVASLLNLSKRPAGQMTIVEVGSVGLIVDVINVVAKAEAQHNIVAILFYLSSNNPDASRSATNQGRAIAAGTVPALAALLSTDDLARDSIALLSRIAKKPSSIVAVLSQSGLVAHSAASL
uniref:Armadillo repeat-containing domain-containing protein n=2 Tax=Oryza TaxID=4527 RepID=A0A0D3HIG9_9ORYZ